MHDTGKLARGPAADQGGRPTLLWKNERHWVTNRGCQPEPQKIVAAREEGKGRRT